MSPTNEFGQPVGTDLQGWSSPPFITHEVLPGRHVTARPPTGDDPAAIYSAFKDAPESMFTYMSFHPFGDPADVAALLGFMEAAEDWLGYVFEVEGGVEGFAAYLRINPGEGVIEIGSIMFSPRMQRTTAATEAIYLMLGHAFGSGYRRVEWKCDALNEPSRRAGERLGFRYEGTFRNATHYKGRNRDTAWFAVTAEDWPDHRRRLEIWLDPANFDESGRQISALGEIRDELP
jgi:RimJ/RimL family protein N-acetyltransferase